MKFYVFLGNGFETVEALGVVDILRRGKVDVCTVSINDTREVISSHNIPVIADIIFDESDYRDGDGLLIPGGLKGVENLEAHNKLAEVIDEYAAEDKYVTAICAGPSILGHHGLLKGRNATCYPGFEKDLEGAVCKGAAFEVDGKFITGKGMGKTLDFALAILEALTDRDTAKHVAMTTMFAD
ncbi:MAG: DJ-1 family glyoxalase III [Butyrivibrio sp.]